MALTPVEVRHIQLKGGMFGYSKSAVHRMMDDIADSFETVWRERSQLVERVEELETEVARHVELEGLLRSTLVSAEKASRDLKEAAQKEADVIVTEANAEARKVLRDAITEKETLLSDVRRVQAVLRSALNVVDEAPTGRRAAARVPEPAASLVEALTTPAPVPAPAALEAAAPYEPPVPDGWTETRIDEAPVEETVAYEPLPAETLVDGPPLAESVADEVQEPAESEGTMADWPIGGRSTEPPPFQVPSLPGSTGEIRKLAG
jgi:cell division initiation protein